MARVSDPGFSAVACLVVFACLSLASSSRGAEQPTRVALLPFENVSGSIASINVVMPLLESALHERGWQLAGQDQIEQFLFRHRIRNSGMLSRTGLEALRQELGVGLAVVGSVALYNDSTDNPQWGLCARVVSVTAGDIIWGEAVGATGGDFTTVLGLGTIRSVDRLAAEVVKRLLRHFPREGQPFAVPRPERDFPELHRLYFGLRAGYVSPTLKTDPPRRIAVLPFENTSERKGAGRIVTDVFLTALVQRRGFEVIDPGVVLQALVATGAAPYGAIDLEMLTKVGKQVEADAVIIGSVLEYNEGLPRAASTSPEVALDARMLDVGTGRILWFAAHSRRGEDSQLLLEFGKIKAMVPLVLKVTREMVGTL
jgi:TolB-like protein